MLTNVGCITCVNGRTGTYLKCLCLTLAWHYDQLVAIDSTLHRSIAFVQEHLFLVCELLRANLYEFQKYNREHGQEPYFTVPRIQSIARQVFYVPSSTSKCRKQQTATFLVVV